MVTTMRLAVRRLLRVPSFTITAAATLALGIGGATAVFTVLDAVLLQPLPYPDANRLVGLSHTLAVAGLTQVDQSDATYLLYRRANHAFTDVGAYRAAAVNFSKSSSDAGANASAPERIAATFATASTFHVLGSAALRGRTLSDIDERPGAPPVALISRGLWQRDFGGDSHILGRRVTVDGVSRSIIGVMSGSFRFPDADVAVWLPLAFDPSETNSAAFDYHGIARLRPGVTTAMATADLQRLLPQVPVEFPGRLTTAGITTTHMHAQVQPLRDVIVGSVARVLWILFGAVVVLLLIACANVANLLLARAESRQRDVAIRVALGARWRVLVTELLAESGALAAVGGALGLVLAAVGVRLLRSLHAAAALPRLADVHVSATVVVFAVVTCALAAVVVSLAPLLRPGHSAFAVALITHAPSGTAGRDRHRVRRGLVVSQVALALILLAGAGLFARSYQQLRAVQPGFDADHALSFRIALPSATYPSAADAARQIVSILGALDVTRGVLAAGIATHLPLDATAAEDSAVFIEGRPIAPGMLPGIHHMVFATPGYFAAMGIPVVAGRLFAGPVLGPDSATVLRDVVVSQAFAARYWKNGDAIGKRIRMFPLDPWSTIVGVVGDSHDDGLDQASAPVVYIPITTATAAGAAWTPHDVAFVVRSAADPTALAAPIRRALTTAAPALPIYRMMPMRDALVDAMARTTFIVLLLGIAAVLAMAIGAAGIYGVIAFLVSLRTREIGVRLALGARPAGVRRMVVRRAVTDAAIGIGIGIISAQLLTHVLVGVLFDVSPADPLTLAAAAAVLLATAVVAAWVPARRASRLDPAQALRRE
jgi:predicted permease